MIIPSWLQAATFLPMAPTLRAVRGVLPENVAAHGLGLLPAGMGAGNYWLPSPQSLLSQGHPRHSKGWDPALSQGDISLATTTSQLIIPPCPFTPNEVTFQPRLPSPDSN